MFLQVIKDIGNHVLSTGEYSLEFVKQGVFLFVFIRFWRKDELCRVLKKRNGRVLGQSAAEWSLISFIMSVFSTEHNIVSCSGSTLETIQLVDDSPTSKHSLQRPLRFDDFSIARLMHKESYSVFGRIDFHSVFQNLIIFLGGCLDSDWTLLTPILSQVIVFI